MAKKIVDIADLQPDIRNANKGTQRGRGMVEASLREVGAGRSIVTDKDGRVIAGNKTLEAAADIGLKIRVVETTGQELVVVQRNDLDLSDDTGQARKLAYYDNRAGETGLAWDAEILLADLNNGVDLSGMFNAEELDALLDGLIEKEPVTDAGAQVDKAAELQKQWGTSLGQIWQLGKHRLACGDCTDKATVERLMQGERAAITFTSPPYNAGETPTETQSGKASKYKDDEDSKDDDDYLGLLSKFTDAALSFSDYVFVNIQMLSGNKKALISYLFNLLDNLADISIWDKVNAQPAMAHRVMDSRFEFVIVFSHGGTRAIGTRDFRGMVHNVYTGQPQRNNEYADSHSATFPLELPSHFIKTFTNSNDIVLEPFCGTGTTLMACEQLARQCRAVEISPAYCAVILQRFADSIGQTPVLINE